MNLTSDHEFNVIQIVQFFYDLTLLKKVVYCNKINSSAFDYLLRM